MSARTELLLSLRQEILGPRQSCYEVLPSNQEPRNEFITGVLIPRDASEEDAREIEGEAETLGTGIDEYADDDSEEEVPVAASAPVLDPKSLPRSMGISFIVRATDEHQPQIVFCATWARYKDEKDPRGKQVFRRIPNCYLTPEPIPVAEPLPIPEIDAVRISLRSVKRGENTYKVSIYLVNETCLIDSMEESGKRRFETSDMIFQPQIRVVCAENTELLPFDSFEPAAEVPEPGSLEEEDESLALIYREYQAYARGHLCAAVWQEIDPERPCQGENPLRWIDGEVVDSQYGEQQGQQFVKPDCRTEYVPCYPIQSPEIDWNLELTGQTPELSTAQLAETWNHTAMREALQPLVDGYGVWISQQQARVNELDCKYLRAGNRHLESCDRALLRMQEAIDLIVGNEEVRLAFCLANKAIDLQASWKGRGRDFRWRPFQLAFVLMNIPAIANPLHPDRRTCDLLAFATGGGKTEAYLGLAAFTMGLRRLRSQKDTNGDRTGQGVSVISRYTLRLLTIQQFRRALGLITACEVLRVENLGKGRPVGWRPKNCSWKDSNIWGTTRFSAGLWVGGSVTPNALKDKFIKPTKTYLPGAISALAGKRGVEGEPGQILNCPCCGSILAVPKDGLGTKQEGHTIHLVMKGDVNTRLLPSQVIPLDEMTEAPVFSVSNNSTAEGYITLSINFNLKASTRVFSVKLDDWWKNQVKPHLIDAELVAFRISRSGYFKKAYTGSQGAENIENFEIYCPNPKCGLNNEKKWNEKVPLQFNSQYRGCLLDAPNNFVWEKPIDAFSQNCYSLKIPISAFTADDQIYSRIPSLLVATVDKFARLAFEPRAGSLFGNINRYCSREGYYRANAAVEPKTPQKQQKDVNPLLPPDLILQDELHLIEGPLGSMVGLYETAVDTLCEQMCGGKIVSPKYIASTATVRQSQSQIQCLFDRSVFQFPPLSLSAADSFFARTPANVHPIDTDANSRHPSGRLYVGVCAPGKGAQTPLVRLYSSMLQSIWELRQAEYNDTDCDPFWTLVGYFNAIRELAGALTLYRQDIPERLRYVAGSREVTERELGEEVELSSRKDSTELPGLLTSLGQELPEAKDIVLSTSMFGTGVDIDRLGLMIVNGQPKTTSSYIQATGRVGRSQGGLVITFFRASRPRDLDHYEFFTGYHRAIYRYVEPITVTPFAARARERGMGPVAVALLRQAREIQGVPVAPEWVAKTNASVMQNNRNSATELERINQVINRRSQIQLPIRRPPEDQVDREVRGGFDRWQTVAENENNLVYQEYAIDKDPTAPVVLGDEQHQERNFTVVYRNAPQSLREVEGMTRFGSIRSNQSNQKNQRG
ncbi:DISARM system helicase DrmA [Microcoleus sp. Pol14C2]|uniref:DISARM system helicase DrmA n=1 Tax=unclassified Microcoleus TaxID=2642155 RepID=UPI002FD50DA3